MEKWTYEDVVDLLKQDYCLHYRNKQKFEKNDDEVDANYELAQMDYIFKTLVTITGKSTDNVADELSDLLDGVFLFDPHDNPNLLAYYKNQSFYAAQDIYYCDYSDFCDMFDEEDIDTLAEFMDINEYTSEVNIPKGTKMTYIGDSENGWPTFEIHGEEFDFAGDAFKLKPCR